MFFIAGPSLASSEPTRFRVSNSMTDNGSAFSNKLLETLAMGSLQNRMNGNSAGNNQQPQQMQYPQGKGAGGQWYRGGRGFGHSLRQQPQGPGLHEKVDKLSEAIASFAKAQPHLFAQQPTFQQPTPMPATGQPVVTPAMQPTSNGQPLFFSPSLPPNTTHPAMARSQKQRWQRPTDSTPASILWRITSTRV